MDINLLTCLSGPVRDNQEVKLCKYIKTLPGDKGNESRYECTRGGNISMDYRGKWTCDHKVSA